MRAQANDLMSSLDRDAPLPYSALCGMLRHARDRVNPGSPPVRPHTNVSPLTLVEVLSSENCVANMLQT